MSSENETHATSKLFSVFALLGFTALILIGAWSAYQVVKFAPRLWGGEALTLPSINLSGAPKVAITLGDEALVSHKPIALTWDASGNLENGVFSFAYACKEGLRIDVLHTDTEGKEAYRPLPCNAAYSIPATDRSLSITPVTTSTGTVDGAIALTFTNEDGESVRDTKNITVEGGRATETETETEAPIATETPETPTAKEGARTPIKEGAVTYGDEKPKQKTTTVQKTTTRTISVPVYPKNDPYGVADLSVSITNIQGGYGYARGIATFRVTNLGTKETGVWHFVASLPTYGTYSFTSDPQSSILPNGHTDITVSFDQSVPGGQFAVQVDPHGVIYETNEYNNYATRIVY